MEIEKRNDRIRALRDLTDYFQELSEHWKNEEELFAEMTVERRKKRAALA